MLAHNLANGGDDARETFALLLRDPDSNEVIGGLYGKVSYRWLLIDLISVPESMRGQGIGERLMRMAEEVAQKNIALVSGWRPSAFRPPSFIENWVTPNSDAWQTIHRGIPGSTSRSRCADRVLDLGPITVLRSGSNRPISASGHGLYQYSYELPVSAVAAAVTPCAARTRSAARSAMTTHGAIVLPTVIRGMIEASAMRSLSMPYTRS